jgi:hypothetical protein
MASATVPSTSLLTVLLGPDVDPVPALAQSMDTAGVSRTALGAVPGLSVAAQRELRSRLATVAVAALDLDVLDVLLAGWRTHARLVAAANRTLASTGGEEVVNLVAHRLQSIHRPYVVVAVDGVQVARLDLEVIVIVDIKALVGVLRAGRLVSLRGGQGQVTATLAAEGIQLAEGRLPLDLSVSLPLGSGIPLAASQADRPRSSVVAEG